MVELTRSWWTIILRGLAAVLFGLAAIILPGMTVRILVTLFGAYVLIDGIFALVGSIRAMERHTRWWPMLIEGIAGIVAGLFAFFFLHLTGVALLFLIAAWAFVTGFSEIIAAIQFQHTMTKWLLGLAGIVSLAVAVLLVVRTDVGVITIARIIGVYAIIFGAILLGLGFRVRDMERAGRTGGM
ncbi:HdeD family acid-resistance protein [Nitrolancea hollandica]|uniref:HdeD family acid-resistance protein n=1 Tax=Nitrolancea hollandica Lb TaxID=1129897 RepID=I4EDV0_9BACT|nr:HdeD family acid-resistance protein [Nitrolancea hollandica]CCF82862.1 conserved membrane hypothetical protein [Nitrolancea hollandica Lb]